MIQKRIISVFKSNPVSLAIVPIIVIVLSFGLNYAYATWSEPSGTPPNNNTDTPLNVGVAEQMKTGNLGINTVLPVGHAHSVQAVFSVGNQNNPFNVDNAGDIVVTGGTDGRFAFYHMPPGSTAPSEKISFEPDGSMTLMKDGGSVVVGHSWDNAYSSYINTGDVWLRDANNGLGAWASSQQKGGMYGYCVNNRAGESQIGQATAPAYFDPAVSSAPACSAYPYGTCHVGCTCPAGYQSVTTGTCGFGNCLINPQRTEIYFFSCLKL